MLGHSTFYVPDATAALLDYVETKRPQPPYILLYFQTPDAIVLAADEDDIDSDWYDAGQVVHEVERRLSERYVRKRRKVPMDYFAEWDLKAK